MIFIKIILALAPLSNVPIAMAMTGKTPTPTVRIKRANPAPAAVETPLLTVGPPANDPGLDPRFASWLSSFTATNGGGKETNSVKNGAEVFFEMFTPIGS